MNTVEARLHERGWEVPDPPSNLANYVGAVQTGNLVFVSGHAPTKDGVLVFTGKVGSSVDKETAREAAALVALNCLGTLKAALGDLNRVCRVVKVLGLVNSDPSFVEQPYVIDGASEVLVTAFGATAGSHARTAVGMVALPWDISVELEMIVEVTS